MAGFSSGQRAHYAPLTGRLLLRRIDVTRRMGFVLEIEHALRQHPRTPSVMVFESQTETISLILRG